MSLCIVVPFYNNVRSVAAVIESLLNCGYNVIAVDDGSTDGSRESLTTLSESHSLELIGYKRNKGKGFALKTAFKKALEGGYTHAVVFDADGQHTLSGLQAILEAYNAIADPNTIVIGNRWQKGADSGGRFANKFSNFWLKVQTLKSIQDTQSGLRLYPLHYVARIKTLSHRYEYETEILVKSLWSGVRVVETPVEVIYQEDRVTHFRPFKDFFRISILNTYLTILSPLYGYPKLFYNALKNRG